MSFEEIKNLSLICVFIWLIYEINWKSKDQEGGKWGAFGSAGIAAVLFICFTVLRFAMGRCGPASLDDLFLLRARNQLFCSSTLELSYTLISALILSALWNGMVTLYRLLKIKEK